MELLGPEILPPMGCVKLGNKFAFSTPTAGRTTQIDYPISRNPWEVIFPAPVGIIRMVKDRLIHHYYDPYLGRKLLPYLSHIIFEDMKMISRKYTQIKLYHYPLMKSNLIPSLTKMLITC